MAFEGKAFDSIDVNDILALQANGVSESKILEYKRSLPGDGDEDRKEFLKDASSFANSSGGHLIFGIEEKKGVPTSIPGIGSVNPDKERQRLENMLRDGVSPRIPGVHIREVELADGQLVVLLKLPRSWISPHMVIFKNWSRFFSRNSTGVVQLDVTQIRAAFALSETGVERLKAFRLQRVSDVAANKAPILLPELAASIVLHIVPLSSAEPGGRSEFDLFAVSAPQIYPLYTISGTVNESWPNFDGIVGVSKSSSYVQCFRNGAVEVADTNLLAPKLRISGETPNRLLLPKPFEDAIIQAVKRSLNYQRELGVEPPIAVMLSLIGVSGYRIYVHPSFIMTTGSSGGRPIDRDVLLFPDILLENFDVDLRAALLPLFDMVWNAGGYPHSFTMREVVPGKA